MGILDLSEGIAIQLLEEFAVGIDVLRSQLSSLYPRCF